MGLLDTVISTIRGDQSSSQSERVLLLPVVVDFINNHPGGLAGLLRKCRQEGLGDIVASWVGMGQNLPISPAQLQAVLGDEAVTLLAGSAGQKPATLLANFANLLPTLVDHVTPMGRLGKKQELDIASLMGSVSGLLRKL